MQRAAAKEKLEQWEANHRWHVAAARALGGGAAAQTKAWQVLITQFEACHRRVQSLKATIRGHQVHLHAFAEEEAALKVEQADAQGRLRAALGTMVAVDAASVEPLLDVAYDIERAWMAAALPNSVAVERAPIMQPIGEAARLRFRRAAP